jgi:hypothetical protein
MKRIDVTIMILLSLLTLYLFYGLIKESWTRIDYVLLIVLLAGGIINSAVIEGDGKKKSKEVKNSM